TNLVVQESIDRAAASLSEGSALAPSLAATLPPLAIQMIAVGEESGRLEELCLRVADTYDQEVRRALRTGVTLLEPEPSLFLAALATLHDVARHCRREAGQRGEHTLGSGVDVH